MNVMTADELLRLPDAGYRYELVRGELRRSPTPPHAKAHSQHTSSRIFILMYVGTRAVVIIDPRTAAIHVHRPSSVENVEDTLEVEDIVPGWKMKLAEIFAGKTSAQTTDN